MADVRAFAAAWLASLWSILMEAGVWLLAGLVLAGVIHAFVPARWLTRHLYGRGIAPVLKAAAVGVPLPLCSCSVVPAAAGLRRRGVGRGPAAAFAISTPEVDGPSVALTWGLLGPWVAIARPVAALATAVSAGWLIQRLDRGAAPPADVGGEEACCADAGAGMTAEGQEHASWAGRSGAALRYALVDLPIDLAPSLVLGLLLAAAVGAAVPEGLWHGGALTGLTGMLLALAIGAPLYVCATASTPLAAALVVAGFTPGAALVFMLAGPATNTTTMAWVVKDLGWRSLWVYLGTIAVVALGAGLLFDAVVPRALTHARAVVGEAPEHAALGVFGGVLAGVLALGLIVRAHRLIGRWARGRGRESCCE